MGAASRTVAERHAIDRTVARFEELYTALLARRH
jgi:hypothetical protein